MGKKIPVSGTLFSGMRSLTGKIKIRRWFLLVRLGKYRSCSAKKYGLPMGLKIVVTTEYLRPSQVYSWALTSRKICPSQFVHEKRRHSCSFLRPSLCVYAWLPHFKTRFKLGSVNIDLARLPFDCDFSGSYFLAVVFVIAMSLWRFPFTTSCCFVAVVYVRHTCSQKFAIVNRTRLPAIGTDMHVDMEASFLSFD
jgi:hypothetical protein